jgi:hypothetical protein
VHIQQFGPKLDELGEMLHGEAFIHGDFAQPSVVFQSLVNFPFFPL